VKPITLGDARLFRDLFVTQSTIYKSGFSSSGKKLLEDLQHCGVIRIRHVAAKSWQILPLSYDGFLAHIKTYYNIDDFQSYIQALELMSPSREDLSALGVSTKLRRIGPKTGMHVNAPSPLEAVVGAQQVNLCFPDGTALFIHENINIEIPLDVVIVGVENFTNITSAFKQSQLFEHYGRVLFAERCGTLQTFLSKITNNYVHYGDIDLAGIHIYQTEYAPILGNRASFYLPCAVEELFVRFKGLRGLYEQQRHKYASLAGIDERMQMLIDEIRTQKKGIEQESFINLGVYS